MNYETADDSFITTVNDVFSHASSENENSPISEDGEITPILIRQTIEEVFVRKPTRMHVNKKNVQAYRGLKLKSTKPSVSFTWFEKVLGKTPTSSPRTTPVDSPNGLP